MILASKEVIGMHDFSAFRASDCSAKTTIRTVVKSEIELVDENELLYVIEGKGFLKHMVRAIIGTLVEVGQSKRELGSVSELIESRNRANAGQTAPAHGLCLENVTYLEA